MKPSLQLVVDPIAVLIFGAAHQLRSEGQGLQAPPSQGDGAGLKARTANPAAGNQGDPPTLIFGESGSETKLATVNGINDCLLKNPYPPRQG